MSYIGKENKNCFTSKLMQLLRFSLHFLLPHLTPKPPDFCSSWPEKYKVKLIGNRNISDFFFGNASPFHHLEHFKQRKCFMLCSTFLL